MTQQEAVRMSVEILDALPGQYFVIAFPEDPKKGTGLSLFNPKAGMFTLWNISEWERH